MIERQRLIPAVILGAMGLLALKVIGWSSQPYSGTVPASPLLFGQEIAAPARPPESSRIGGSAEIVARAPAPGRLFDPETTGSIDKPAAKPAAEAPAPPPNPNDKSAIMNGTSQPMSAAERAVLERLSERRSELEARQRELELRERLLDSAEKRLDGRVGDLKTMEDKNGAGAGKAPVEEAKALQNLVIMYEAMKPKDAARVFDRLGLEVLVPVVQKMNPRKMSEVLAAMAPERAERLTVALATAGRNATPAMPTLDAALPGNELPAIAPPRR